MPGVGLRAPCTLSFRALCIEREREGPRQHLQGFISDAKFVGNHLLFMQFQYQFSVLNITLITVISFNCFDSTLILDSQSCQNPFSTLH